MAVKNPLLLAVAAATLAAACTTPVQAKEHVVAEPVVGPSPITIVEMPQPPVPAPVEHSPLTGLAPHKDGLVVIKVDNASTARPFQRGLNHAAIVYQELVESGQTRFAAVYDGSWSGEVGPIRSARETDLELLAQYGRITLGFSGANKGVMANIQKAVQRGQIRDASHETVPSVYREGVRRRDSYQFFSTPNKLRAAKPGVSAKDIGLSFAPLAATAGRSAGAATIAFSSTGKVVIRYNKATGRYAVFQDGTPMKGVAPANVIVQRVPIRGSKYVDVLGSRTPYTTSTGKGSMVLFRSGRLVTGSWRRLTVQTGTRFLDDKGRDLPLKPGPTWILLQPQGQPLTWSS